MSEARPDKLCVALLGVPESTASTLYGMYDVLESAGRDWSALIERRGGEPALKTLIVSAGGERFRAPNGLAIEPHCTLADCPRPDVIAISDLMVMPDEELGGRYEAEIAWIRDAYAHGAVVATACTGALVLAEAGLLDGQDVTTHWAYCDAMQRRYPGVKVHPNRSLVVSGEEHRLVLAGGGTSWHDLALYLIARFVDTEEAMRVARLQLLTWHHVGQLPFAAVARKQHSADALIARCQEWIAQHYDEAAPVAAMARLSGLAERSFKRRFARATGMSPLEYVHTLRLEESKQLLETSDSPVEEIAAQAGYEDASFFGRLFRRRVGITPAQYRKRFRTLRRELDQKLNAKHHTRRFEAL
jgi:transcriptional regulator GlxA family with amidase domain